MSEGSNTGAMRKAVFAVTEKGDKSYWTKVGAAFPNRDGSWTLRLDAFPMSGTLQMRDEDNSQRRGGGQ